MSKSIAWVGAVILAAATGCAPMCQSPWDYCNAVTGPSGTPNCNFIARYNSRFAPMNDVASDSGAFEPTPAGEDEGLTAEPTPVAPTNYVR